MSPLRSTNPHMRAVLVLGSGEIFTGLSYGAQGKVITSLRIHTTMDDYQNTVSNPAFSGEIAAMTFPHIGNVGIVGDVTSFAPTVSGLVVRDPAIGANHNQTLEELAAVLERHGVVGISGIDTRRLTRVVQEQTSVLAGIFSGHALLDNQSRTLTDQQLLDQVQTTTTQLGA